MRNPVRFHIIHHLMPGISVQASWSKLVKEIRPDTSYSNLLKFGAATFHNRDSAARHFEGTCKYTCEFFISGIIYRGCRYPDAQCPIMLADDFAARSTRHHSHT